MKGELERLAERVPIIRWKGGECPLPADALVQVQFRYNRSIEDNPPDGVKAGQLRWTHLKTSTHAGSGDIIAYRDLRALSATQATEAG